MSDLVSQQKVDRAVEQLKIVYKDALQDIEFQKMFNAKDSVISRYQKIFSLEHLPNLTKEEFLDFLKFENNQHWTPLYRQQTIITSDMDELRAALLYLVDESIPLKQRLDKLRPKGTEAWIKGLSKAIITPILLISRPENYGVWNGTAENGMKNAGIWPPVKTTAPFSEKYLAINEVLQELSQKLGLDLWTLDGLWWGVKQIDPDTDITSTSTFVQKTQVSTFTESAIQAFGMERYLQEFIGDNWEQITDFQDWELFTDEDEIVGVEYNTGEIGRIDLLAKHKTDPRWLVIELKRDQASDNTMGQVQRYMGWVRKNLAETSDTVEGLIIAKSLSSRLEYALETVQNIEFMTYEVDFILKKPAS